MSRHPALALALLLAACGQPDDPTSAPHPPIFIDAARGANLDFVYFNGMSGEHYFNEMMGGGAALLDFDNDGDLYLYLYLVQGTMLGRDRSLEDALFPPPKDTSLTDRLYRNDLEPGSDASSLHFTDVTTTSRIAATGYGMGVTTGDFDRDGWLDLYVGNYVDYSLATHTPCPLASGALTYCAPGAYRPVPDSLFRNRGDGTFEDVSLPSGIGGEPGSGLGAGVAVNREGQPEAGMGVDAGDFDGDGDPDLVLGHLEQETNTLYVNGGAGLFRDESASTQLGQPSLPFTAFGIGWIDYDNDSWLDVLDVNGAVIAIDALIRAGDSYPLRQANQFLRNLGNGSFREVTAEAGAVFESAEVSRAAAFGDVDNDGDLDVVVVNSNGPARLLLNQVGQSRPWLGLRLGAHNRDTLGAQILIHRQGAPPIWRHVHTDGSYASARDPRVLVGLGHGDGAEVGHVEVRWPDGTAERWTEARAGEYQTLVQGEGEAIGPRP